jgi:hypothetical protein
MAFMWDARRSERSPLDKPVTVEHNGQIYLGWSLDLSEEGIGVQCPVLLYPEQEVTIYIARQLKLKAEVRHSTKYRHGCSFVGVSEEDKLALKSFLPQATLLSR